MTEFDLPRGRGKLPAVAYITERSRRYLGLPENVPPVTPFVLEIEWAADRLAYGTEGNIQEVHRPYGGPVELGHGGRVYFFRYCSKPDAESSPVPINRLSVLGLTAAGKLGFFREVDYTDGLNGQPGAPALKGCEADAGNALPKTGLLGYEIFASSAGAFRHELVIEAGSPTNLFEF